MFSPGRAPPRARAHQLSRIDKCRPSAPRAPATICRRWIDDVAGGIDRDHGGDIRPLGSVRRLPMPPFMALSPPPNLPTVAPAPAPTLPSAIGRGRPLVRRGVSARWRRPDHGFAADRQIEQHRGRHDRHIRPAKREAVPLFLQIPHHAARGIEPERAAAGEDHRVHLLDEIRSDSEGPSRECPAPSRGRPPRRSPLLGQHDGAAGRPLAERVMTDANPVDGGEPLRPALRERLRDDEQRCQESKGPHGQSLPPTRPHESL